MLQATIVVQVTLKLLILKAFYITVNATVAVFLFLTTM